MSLNDSPQLIPSAAGEPSGGSRAQGKVIVVLPSYNEGPNLGPLFAGIHTCMGNAQLGYEVVLVDDGSSDITAEVLGCNACGNTPSPWFNISETADWQKLSAMDYWRLCGAPKTRMSL